MVLCVPLPCSVRIANARITYVYYAGLIGVLTFCIYNFVATRGGTVALLNTPQVSVIFGVNSIPQATKYDRFSDRQCSLPEHVWYEHNIGPKVLPPLTKLFLRFTCSYLAEGSCLADSNLEACIDLYETKTPSSPFDLKIMLTDKILTLGTNATLENHTGWQHRLSPLEMSSHAHFNVFTQAYELNFSYQFTLETSPPSFFGLNADIPLIGTHRNARTVLLGADGLPVQTFAAGQDILVGAPRVLQLSQGTRDVSLPAHWSTYHPSISGDARSFPSWLWELGSTIYATVNCYSDDFDIARTAGRRTASDHDVSIWELGATPADPVCLLGLTLAATSSTDIATQTKEPGLTVRRLRTSLRIIGKPGTSFFRAYDINAVLLCITSFLVLLGLPKKFIRIVVLNCLGQLSNVYRSVVAKDFDVKQHCARAVMQLVSQSSCFVELAGWCNLDGMQPGLSRHQLRERVQAIVNHTRMELDDAEIEVLVSFAFAQLLNHKTHHRFLKIDDVAGSLTPWHARPGSAAAKPALKCGSESSSDGESKEKGEEQDEEEQNVEVVDIECFCRATGNESLDEKTIVRLFDRHRRYWPGERLFMPADLWHLIHCSGAHGQKEITDSSITLDSLEISKTPSEARHSLRTQLALSRATTSSLKGLKSRLYEETPSLDLHAQQDFSDLAARIERMQAELGTCTVEMQLLSTELQNLRSEMQCICERHAAAVATLQMQFDCTKRELHECGRRASVTQEASVQSSCHQDTSRHSAALSLKTSDCPQDAFTRSNLAMVQEACKVATEQALQRAIVAAEEMAREVVAEEALRVALVAPPASARTEQKGRVANTAMLQTAVTRLHTSQGRLLEAVGQHTERISHIERHMMEQPSVGGIQKHVLPLQEGNPSDGHPMVRSGNEGLLEV